MVNASFPCIRVGEVLWFNPPSFPSKLRGCVVLFDGFGHGWCGHVVYLELIWYWMSSSLELVGSSSEI